jgi:signal transduction histidine kinase
MLSARAGESARIEGIGAGANDYIVKPFSARELIARVAAQIDLSQARGTAAAERARLEELTAKLERANRTKDEFLAILGHELRNPLAPIVTALQVLDLRGVREGEHEHLVIKRQVAHLTRLVDDLLDVSRITSGKVQLSMSRFEVTDIVARAIEIASPLLEQRRHRLHVNMPRTALPIRADSTRIAQVISNLLNNACNYTEPGGDIWIEAEAADGNARIRVRDSGIGIERHMLSDVFNMFVQSPQSTARTRGGLGLGLPIARSLVVLHGGSIQAESAGPNQGSTFTVTLPLALEGEHREENVHPRTSTPPSRLRRVLIVDDNRDAAEMLAEVLSAIGHDTRIAHDGPSALAMLADFSPHVALLDIGLPVMDGYELAQRIRERHGAKMRILAVTGYGQESDRRRSLEAGFDAHLVKPLDLDAVMKVVTQ